jgi:hypothetical protein
MNLPAGGETHGYKAYERVRPTSTALGFPARSALIIFVVHYWAI